MSDPSPAELEQRVRAWHATRTPRALWPAIDPSALQPAADEIGRVVPVLLRGEHASINAADDREAYALGIAGLLTGVGPLLGWWAERGQLEASAPAAAVLARHLFHGRARAERISRGLRPALAALASAGIAPVVMKGMHTGHAYFPEPGTRPASDADVVIAPHEVTRAEAALRGACFAPSPHVRVPYKRDWYPADDDPSLHSLEVFEARDRWKLELHAGVIFERLRGRSLDLLQAEGATVPWSTAFGGITRAPAPAPLVALLAVHASGELDRRRLLRIVELAFVIQRETSRGGLDWRVVAGLLERTGASGFAHPALAQLEKLIPGMVDPALLARTRREAGHFARRIADRFTATAPIVPDQVVLAERFMWSSGVGDILRYAAEWAYPASGRGWREVLRIYHMRLRLLLGGRVSWGLSDHEP